MKKFVIFAIFVLLGVNLLVDGASLQEPTKAELTKLYDQINKRLKAEITDLGKHLENEEEKERTEKFLALNRKQLENEEKKRAENADEKPPKGWDSPKGW
jgi:hypothetical protein